MSGPKRTQELEAFCSTRPAPDEVTAFLEDLDFTLDFCMDAFPASANQLPALPAQYHYGRSPDGMGIIYLAGRDTPMSGEHFPHHASRFWAYAGADASAFSLITGTLAGKWSFDWQRHGQFPATDEVA